MELRENLFRLLRYRIAVAALWLSVGIIFLVSLLAGEDGENQFRYEGLLLRIIYPILFLYVWGAVWKILTTTHFHIRLGLPFLLIVLGTLIQSLEFEGSNEVYKGIVASGLSLLGVLGIWNRAQHVLGLKNWFCGLWTTVFGVLVISQIESLIQSASDWLNGILAGLLFFSMMGAYLSMTILLIRASKNWKIHGPSVEALIDKIGAETDSDS